MDTLGQTLAPASVTMKVLAGDANGNGSVNTSDVGMVKALSGATVNASNFRGDLNANAILAGTDVGVAKTNSGDSVS